jgi:hypothetical protein
MVRPTLLLLRWKIKLRALSQQFVAYMEEKSWHKKPLSVFLLYVFGVWLLLWNLHIPSPGKSVAALAVAAAVMTLMGELGGKEKVAWILILFGFLWVEIISIDVERKAQDELQRSARAEQLAHFKEIGGGIRDSIKESDVAANRHPGQVGYSSSSP